MTERGMRGCSVIVNRLIDNVFWLSCKDERKKRNDQLSEGDSIFPYIKNMPSFLKKMVMFLREIKERCIPSKERAQNTVAIKLRMLQAFYTELEDRDEIDVSAFRKLDKNRRKVVMKESYDAPVYLLQEAKEAFLLQCTFGSHIDDFKSLNMDKVLSVPRGFLTYAICLRKH